jgi:ribosomal protein L36
MSSARPKPVLSWGSPSTNNAHRLQPAVPHKEVIIPARTPQGRDRAIPVVRRNAVQRSQPWSQPQLAHRRARVYVTCTQSARNYYGFVPKERGTRMPRSKHGEVAVICSAAAAGRDPRSRAPSLTRCSLAGRAVRNGKEGLLMLEC